MENTDTLTTPRDGDTHRGSQGAGPSMGISIATQKTLFSEVDREERPVEAKGPSRRSRPKRREEGKRQEAVILVGDVMDHLRSMADESVHCVMTSPPYWGLRDYGHAGQIGLEETPEAYVARMVEVFREVRRVLRDDGTLWLNLGDSYARTGGWASNDGLDDCKRGQSGRAKTNMQNGRSGQKRPSGLKEKDLCGIPWRVAFALQADGWWLRQDIIWHKPNPMPESVRDRCTKAHEYVFLLTKSERYFYDSSAIEEDARWERWGNQTERKKHPGSACHLGGKSIEELPIRDKKNRRSVWLIPTKPYKGAHFATMTPRLAELCIFAGTSGKGCCSECGAPVVRQVSRTRVPTRPGNDTKVTGDSMTDGNRDPQRHVTATATTGWKKSCSHESSDVVPCVVLDPFAGSGTTLAVASTSGRKSVGIELNPEYAELAKARLGESLSGHAP